MSDDEKITIRFNDRYGTYSFSPDGTEDALAALTGNVDSGAWAHAVGTAYRTGQPILLAELAANVREADEKLKAAMAKKNIRRVKCACGHECESTVVMHASRGTSCPDCYDRMSD